MVQRLHFVFGGELVDPQHTEFRDCKDIEMVGVFPDYASAFKAWKGKARRRWTTPTCATSSPISTACATRKTAPAPPKSLAESL